VVYGTSSGPVAPFDLDRLLQTGSQYLTRPNLADYVRTHDDLLDRSAELFRLISDGSLTVHVGGRYPLHEVQAAHRDLEGRQTVGKLLLFPHSRGEQPG
jgi:NADPH2:quinone reductase